MILQNKTNGSLVEVKKTVNGLAHVQIIGKVSYDSATSLGQLITIPAQELKTNYCSYNLLLSI
jgi:hypothetical protein